MLCSTAPSHKGGGSLTRAMRRGPALLHPAAHCRFLAVRFPRWRFAAHGTLQLAPSRERRTLARRNVDLLASSGVDSGSGRSLADLERAEARQRDLVAGFQRTSDGFNRGIDGFARIDLSQA